METNHKKILLQFKNEVLKESIIDLISRKINDIEILNDLEKPAPSKNFDLIISEYKRQHSWEITSFIEQTKRIDAKVPFILIGPQISSLAINRCIKNGASHYLPNHQLILLPSIVEKLLFLTDPNKVPSSALDNMSHLKDLAIPLTAHLHKIEEMIALKSQSIEGSNKGLEEFAHLATQNLQEPLRRIDIFLQLLRKKSVAYLTEKDLKFLHFTEQEVIRMNHLLANLSTFSRLNKSNFNLDKVDLNQLLLEIVHGATSIIKQSKAIIKVDHLPVIFCNKAQIKQVFQNLISNGIKFQPEGRLPQIEIKCIEDEKEYCFSVKDNGIGIEGAHIDQIFQPLKTLNSKDKYAGSGLGLAICKKIIEYHQGKIWLESKIGTETTFFFTLSKHLK